MRPGRRPFPDLLSRPNNADCHGHSAWRAGAYRLATLPAPEDPAGNRVGRAFDFDPQAPEGAAGGDGTHERALLPFTVSPRAPAQPSSR